MTVKLGAGRGQNRVTIKDVAALANTSLKTVSRVLNNEPNVRAETRERVQQAMRELDYHPSMSARSLAGGKSSVIGLTYGHPRPNYFVDVMNGAIDRCQEAGFHLFLYPCMVGDEDLPSKIASVVQRAHLDGFVLTPPICDFPELIAKLDDVGVRFSRIAPGLHHDHISPYVTLNDRRAAEDMTDYLISLGHRRIGFIGGDPRHVSAARRLQGYRNVLERHAVPLDESLIREGWFTFEAGREQAHALLKLPDRPTAIFASNDEMAAGAITAAHEAGLSLPDDLSIAGFDDIHIAQMVWPQLTTVHQPIYDMAHAATGLLLDMLTSGDVPRPPAPFPHELVVRGSTAPLNA
jgi:LacI family transcriptional regulator